jgi:hypothetical protein
MAGIAPVVTVLVMVRAVLMVNLHVLMDLVSMAHGHVTVMVTVLTAQMKLTVVLPSALRINLTVMVMELSVSMLHGNVMDLQNMVMQDGLLTVPMVQMKILILAVN